LSLAESISRTIDADEPLRLAYWIFRVSFRHES
jgi:hypothetical protein